MDKQKPIYILLNILLILGAIISVATINRGQWIGKVLAYYQPIVIGVSNQSSELSAGGAGEVSAAESGARTPPECLKIRVPSGPDWRDSVALLDASHICQQDQAAPANHP